MPTEPIWSTIAIDRAPVLRLWAAVVAERRGHSPDAALTLALSPGLARERRRGGWYHRDTTSGGGKAAARAAASDEAGVPARLQHPHHVDRERLAKVRAAIEELAGCRLTS